MEAIRDFLESVLDLVDSHFVFKSSFSPIFQFLRAFVERMLDLADDIGLDCLLPFGEVAHDLLVSSFDHLAEHFDILLPFFGHFLKVQSDFALQILAFLFVLLVPHFLLAPHVVESLALLLQLLLNFFLLPLHLV